MLASTRQTDAHSDLVPGETCLDTADAFNLLGSRVQSDGEADAEVAARIRSAGEAWHRLRPACFACKHVSLPTRFRIFTVSVLSRLLYGSETWGFTRRQQHPVFSLRYLAGLNLDTGINDAVVRRRLRAPPLQELLDRAILRWLGHCARMSSVRIPQQLLTASVPQWSTVGGRGNWLRYRYRITGALRRFGIDDRLAFDAAQHASQWRARLKVGWAPDRREESNVGPDSDNADNESDSASDEPDTPVGKTLYGVKRQGASVVRPAWPQRSTVCRTSQRACRPPQDFVCTHCGYSTPFVEWFAMHCARVHPDLAPDTKSPLSLYLGRRLRAAFTAATLTDANAVAHPRRGVG